MPKRVARNEARQTVATEVAYRYQRLQPERGFDKELKDLTVALFESRYGLRFAIPRPGGDQEEVEATLLDLPGISELDTNPTVERTKVRAQLANILHLNERDLDAPETIEKLNRALREGYNYLVVHQRFEASLVPELKEIHSFDDVVTLMLSTKLYKPDEKRGSRRDAQIVMNCALLTAAFASFELDKKEMQALRGRAMHVESFFNGDIKANREPLFIPRNYQRSGAPGTQVGINGLIDVTGSLHMRDKNRFRAMGKMIRDPRASEDEALKDGIGFRLEVPRAHVGSAMFKTISYLINHLRAHDILVEDQNMFADNPHEWTDLQASLQPLYPNTYIQYKQSNRPGRYRTVKVTAHIMVPRDPANPRSLLTAQRIEFQVVDVGNKNEAGLANHNVYELFQTFVEERTRLMGGISEVQLRRFAADIREKGAPKYESIRDGLIKDGVLFQLPDTSVKKFASVKIWRRWVKIQGLLPQSIRSKVAGKLPPLKKAG